MNDPNSAQSYEEIKLTIDISGVNRYNPQQVQALERAVELMIKGWAKLIIQNRKILRKLGKFKNNLSLVHLKRLSFPFLFTSISSKNVH
jgi:hypothetical protein